jgi:hypothetical protein
MNTPMSAATCGTMAQRFLKKFAICVDDDDRADDHVARYRLAHGGLPFAVRCRVTGKPLSLPSSLQNATHGLPS